MTENPSAEPITAAPAIAATQITTGRTATCIRQIPGREASEPVVLIHGNLGSSVFMFPIMQHLPRRYRPIAVDLRGFGGSDPEPVDATRGVRDFADDIRAVLDALGLDSAHVIGHSLGGAVAMQLAIDAATRIKSLTLIAPISPYGFGSGAGMVSQRFLTALVDGDLTSPAGPRGYFRKFMTGPAWDGSDEEELLASMLSTAIGPDNYPGDRGTDRDSPGRRGVMNAISPRYCDLSDLAEIDPKPPILWLRGDADQVISDSETTPMLGQTRAVLRRYVDGGGIARELVLPAVGHLPQFEDLPRVMEAIIPHLDGAARS